MRDDVDTLGYSRHAEILAVADEYVQPNGHGQGVGNVVPLLSSFISRSPLGVPDVPLIEADGGSLL